MLKPGTNRIDIPVTCRGSLNVAWDSSRSGNFYLRTKAVFCILSDGNCFHVLPNNRKDTLCEKEKGANKVTVCNRRSASFFFRSPHIVQLKKERYFCEIVQANKEIPLEWIAATVQVHHRPQLKPQKKLQWTVRFAIATVYRPTLYHHRQRLIGNPFQAHRTSVQASTARLR